MLKTPQILGKLIQKYVQSSIEGDRECRLLIPGLTREIAIQLHSYLRENIPSGIAVYLVIEEDGESNGPNGLINAVSMTSVRIGSFIAVVSPGELTHLPDSIGGTGGTVRSLTFTEDWPWREEGSEAFRFDGPVLDAFIESWSKTPAEQKWLREFTLQGLVKYTKSSSQRAQILLEKILGTFDPTLYPEIEDIRKKVLFHAGIPCPSGAIDSVKKLIQDSVRLSEAVFDRLKNDGRARELAREKIAENILEEEQESVRASLDFFLDGIGRSLTQDLGLLAFHGCWGDDPSHWIRLNAACLEDLFDVRQHKQPELSCKFCPPPQGFVENDKKMATFLGDPVEIEINYYVQDEAFSTGQWAIRILYRKRSLVPEQILTDNQGQIHIQFETDSFKSYSGRLPLRIEIVSGNEVKAKEILDLHLCGKERPVLVVITPGFDVVDATCSNEEETVEEKIIVEDPVQLFFLVHERGTIPQCYEDDDNIPVIETEMTGIWQSARSVDPTDNPSGQVTWECKFGDLNVTICFEAKFFEKGEFTIDEELLHLITTPKTNEKHLKELVNLFEGKTNEPYLALGGIDNVARWRIHLATIVTKSNGWRPLLINLFEKGSDKSDQIGNFINHIGSIEGEAFKSLELPEDALALLRDYSTARDAILQEVESRVNASRARIEHPIYACYPIFVFDRSKLMEELICTYLETYRRILIYLQNTQNTLEWEQIFVLTHLDCVVHWDKSPMRNAFWLISPWHPLVITKRFMVQSTLFSRAHRFLNKPDGKKFSHLSTLLGRIQGFRWILGLSGEDGLLEPAIVSSTSDPGWHMAYKRSPTTLTTQNPMDLPTISSGLWRNLGLEIETDMGESRNLAATVISSYLRAYPSRRSIGIRVRRGYITSEVVKNIDKYLHDEDGPTPQGAQLQGGARVYLQEPLDRDLEILWPDPPLHIYQFEDESEFIQKVNADIHMLPPMKEVLLRRSTLNFKIPRGNLHQSVFYRPLTWVDVGRTSIPKSFTYEIDISPNINEGVGCEFVQALAQIKEILGYPLETISSVDLPQQLSAPWMVIPGPSIDPAILVKYVRDGADKDIQERALWDYKIDITGRANSYFILSTIPREFQIAVNGFFGINDTAGKFIVDLGKIGIAIGGEALKSGRHALGIIGLVGAVRLFTDKGVNGRSPLSCNSNSIGFLVPVDSFASFFGKSGFGDGKRTDLLAIQLILPSNNSAGKLRISACGVESKFVSNTFDRTRVTPALAQASSTVQEFQDLVVTSLENDSIPERLALLELLRYGLRVVSPTGPGENKKWVETENEVYTSILRGEYEYVNAPSSSVSAVLVSTEKGLPGPAACVPLQDGLWIRLTKDHWPGINDTPAIDAVRQELCKLFEMESGSRATFTPNQQTPSSSSIEVESTTKVPTREEPESTVGTCSTKGVEPPAMVENIKAEKDAALKKIFIGVDDARGGIYFDPQSPVDRLENLNMMITGSPGMGKTQFLKYLICKFREQEKNVLILDFKNDFRRDTKFSSTARLEKYIVNWDGMPYNPLIPYPLPHPETGEMYFQPDQHILGVTSVLKRTFSLGDQQAVALQNAIIDAYDSVGIPSTGNLRILDTNRFPDFNSVGNILRNTNIKAYYRLQTLFSGLFKQEFQSISFYELTHRSIIIDFSQISSDETKNALSQLVVMSAHSYFNSLQHSGAIRQLFVIDEAFRVLDYEYMANFVMQCRAYGVGMILSSQFPSQFPPDISSSMATKVIHGNGTDNARIKEIVSLIRCKGREEDIARLDIFDAFVDNHHFSHTLFRTMNYPLYLVWSTLVRSGTSTREELSKTDGIDISMLSIEYLIHQLELMGLAEEREGQIIALKREME